MEASFWHERWDTDVVPFDQPEPNPLMVTHWERLGADEQRAVFVPLAGRSVDMVWLASRGHRVIGSELSEKAVTDFFAARGLAPEVRTEGALRVFAAGPYELWCGDFFEMGADALTGVGAVYDRASLVALPPEMRRRYAAHLKAIVPADASLFVIGFEYDQTQMGGPPFSVTRDEIATLFGDTYDLEVVVADDSLDRNPGLGERGLTSLVESVVMLRPGS